jgi:AcrR family transcriptional regulator
MTGTQRVGTRDRVIAAARQCLADRGLKATTVDDVAAAAGISRATLYRAFPGGRDTILHAVADAERARLVGVVTDAVSAAADLRDALIAALSAAASFVADHEVVERLLFEEPAALLTHLEFEQMDRTLAVATEDFAPLFVAYLEPEVAQRVAEWGVRLVASYLLVPSDEFDLATPQGAAILVNRHVLPGVRALAAEAAGAPR